MIEESSLEREDSTIIRARDSAACLEIEKFFEK
jgi:hypothetical protein